MNSESDGSENDTENSVRVQAESFSDTGSGSKEEFSEDSRSTSSTIFYSLSMSQNLPDPAFNEVPQMIRLNSPTTEDASTSSGSNSKFLSDDDPDQQNSSSPPKSPFTQSHKKLEISKNLEVRNRNSYSDESKATLPVTIPQKRTISVGKRNDILIGIVVSRWDNIVGPQCTYLWTEEMTSLFYPGNLPKHLSRLVKYVTDHMIMDHHEVDGEQLPHSTMKSGLCIVLDLNLVYVSLSIRIPSDSSSSEIERPGQTVPHSVAVLANLEYLRHFILMRPLIINWLSEFSPKIGVLICRNKLHLSMINSWCAELCKTMATVRSCWWQKILTKKKERKNRVKLREIKTPVRNGGKTSSAGSLDAAAAQWEYLPPPTDKKALESIITSHLSTGCSTVVVGPDAHAINQVIRFLLCFSKSDEGYCSRYALPTLPDTFMQGLFIQGLISGEIGEKSISSNQLNSNRHPFTHIDLNSKYARVRQMPVYTHQSQRETTLIQELTALWQSTTYVSPQTDPFSINVSETGGFVSKLVADLHLLPPEKRYARLLLFRRMLHAKAVGLITCLQSIQYKPLKERTLLLKHLRETLWLDETEFLIVQMTADKIRPGVSSIIRQTGKVFHF